MSEQSLSYHIRTGDHVTTEQALMAAGFAGLVFGPANGWLTFVPYEELESFRQAEDDTEFACDLARLAGAPVLVYGFGPEDGWGFVLVSGDRISRFFCGWWPTPSPARSDIHVEDFAAFVGPGELLALLGQPHFRAGHPTPPYHFAEVLGLPAYEWLSPELAQSRDLEYFAEEGLRPRVLGTKPPSVEERLGVPRPRSVLMPRPCPAMSAREAWAWVKQFASELRAGWVFTHVSWRHHRSHGGRGGGWAFGHRHPDEDECVYAVLLEGGHLYFPVSSAGRAPPIVAIGDGWLDSPTVADVVNGEPLRASWDPRHLLSLSLWTPSGWPTVWDAFGIWHEGERHASQWRWRVDAYSGAILYGSFKRYHAGTLLEEHQQRTWHGGGEVKEMPLGL